MSPFSPTQSVLFAMRRFLIACSILLFICSPLLAEEKPAAPTPEQVEFFEKHVRPVFVTHCVKCHGEKTAEAGLRLDNRAGLLRGIEGIPVVVGGQPDKSRLVEVMRYDGAVQMPPEKKLPEKDFAAIVKWIASGAIWPNDANTAGAGPGVAETHDIATRLKTARESHWAFQRITRPSIPSLPAQLQSQLASAIDSFVAQKLTSHDLHFTSAADRRTWLRRSTFDLLGLPPSFEQLEEFTNDERPDAKARAVDRLLASPHHGERWGRHWLDIARYSDTKGYVFQQERRFPYAYTYRDYVVRSFNEDLPFDQFVREQLVADQLPPRDDNRSLAALGFLTVGRHFSNVHDDIDDRIDVVTRGLLGLTVACARCHDHKYEAVAADDYYSLYGVFRSCMEPSELPLIGTPLPTEEYKAYLAELAKREQALKTAVTEETQKLRERLRRNIGDFLAVSVLEKRGRQAVLNFKFVAGEPYAPQAKRWRDFLSQMARLSDPVFAPWRKFEELEKLGPDEFAQRARELLTELQSDKRLNPNPRILEAIEKANAKSIFDISAAYDSVFAELLREWQQLHDDAVAKKSAPPERFDDSEKEQLRFALFGPQAPGSFRDEEARGLFEVKVNDRLTKLRREIEQLQVTSNAAPARAMMLQDAPNPYNPYVFVRGNPERRGKNVPRQFLAVLSETERKPFKQGSGRLELANAITDPSNPLTSRVFVNRVWQHHFGVPLVDTPSNFGERGATPSHPELLDYVASEFIASGWSIKTLHREILLSTTYGQSSSLESQRQVVQEKDPDNRLLSRSNRRRLEFEPLRDSMLAASRQLDSRIGGRPVDLTSQPYTRRRTLYGMIDRQELANIFQTFDFASPDVSTERRPETMVPQQALFVMNSPFVAEQARRIAELPEVKQAAEENSRIDQLYRAVLSRRASSEEMEAANQFLKTVATRRTIASGWQHGYGEIDVESSRVVSFHKLTRWTGSQWQGGEKFPDEKLGYVSLRATGGHPGHNARLATILRWTSPANCTVTVTGSLQHAKTEGDGVRGWVISDRQGMLGKWEAHNSQAATQIARIELREGEILDFVVDSRTSSNHDSYQWAPVIKQLEPAGSAQEWPAAKSFQTQPTTPLSPMEMLAQILLLTNEFLFVD